MTTINKLLVANRSEIAIRVFRSATELGIEGLSVDQVLQQLLDQVPAPRV